MRRDQIGQARSLQLQKEKMRDRANEKQKNTRKRQLYSSRNGLELEDNGRDHTPEESKEKEP